MSDAFEFNEFQFNVMREAAELESELSGLGFSDPEIVEALFKAHMGQLVAIGNTVAPSPLVTAITIP